ncbi:ATP-binding protein [Deinococcus sp. UYEF24]
MKLRTRLALLIAGVIVVALMAQGFLGYLNFRHTAQITVRNNLQNYLATLVHDRSEGDAPADLPNENGIRARLIEKGEVVREYGGPFPAVAGADGDDNWLIQRLPAPDLGAGTVVEASIPLRAYNEGLAAYIRTVLLSMGLMSVLGVGAALLVSRGVLRPLGDLLETAERVSRSGRLDERVAEPEGGGEIARLAHTFNAMLERLSAFRQRETEFVRHAAHELKTPLTALRAQVDANREHWVTDAELIQTVDEQVERMTALTAALLTLSRENAAILKPLDLAELARSLAEEYGAQYTGPAAYRLLGNAPLLTQALTNLLQNAHRYAPAAQVSVTLKVESERVLLTVEDHGSGVHAEVLPLLTGAFYRVPGTRPSGSGLGLAVVERVAEVHGGTVLTSQRSPHGLRVQLVLPVKAEVEQPGTERLA